MGTAYEIHVLQCDRQDWVTDLRQAVAAELENNGLHSSVAVVVLDPPAPSDAPGIAVFLGSPSAGTSSELARAVDEILESGLMVVPVVRDLDEYRPNVPDSLAVLNGFEWGGEDPAARLARTLLEELGIEDRRRRVFISHKRDDGLGAAEQLHDALARARFVPFIDRFSIRQGYDVQEVIADALEEHAFLLLLETPHAHASRWVFDEVDYALSHAMGTLIVTWPGDPTPVPGSQGLPRVPLSNEDLVADDHGYEILTDAALDQLVGRVEQAHANGIVRRRRMLIRNVEEAARAGGCDACLPLAGWRLRVERNGEATILGITPRLPVAEDLQELDKARSDAGDGAAAVLVHAARLLRPDRRSHLEWVTGGRDLELMAENAIGGRWL